MFAWCEHSAPDPYVDTTTNTARSQKPRKLLRLLIDPPSVAEATVERASARHAGSPAGIRALGIMLARWACRAWRAEAPTSTRKIAAVRAAPRAFSVDPWFDRTEAAPVAPAVETEQSGRW